MGRSLPVLEEYLVVEALINIASPRILGIVTLIVDVYCCGDERAVCAYLECEIILDIFPSYMVINLSIPVINRTVLCPSGDISYLKPRLAPFCKVAMAS